MSSGSPNTSNASNAPIAPADTQATTTASSRVFVGSIGASMSATNPPSTPAAASTPNHQSGSPAPRSEIASRNRRKPLAARIPTAPIAGPVSSGIRPRGPTSRLGDGCIRGCGRRMLSAADTA